MPFAEVSPFPSTSLPRSRSVCVCVPDSPCQGLQLARHTTAKHREVRANACVACVSHVRQFFFQVFWVCCMSVGGPFVCLWLTLSAAGMCCCVRPTSPAFQKGGWDHAWCEHGNAIAKSFFFTHNTNNTHCLATKGRKIHSSNRQGSASVFVCVVVEGSKGDTTRSRS